MPLQRRLQKNATFTTRIHSCTIVTALVRNRRALKRYRTVQLTGSVNSRAQVPVAAQNKPSLQLNLTICTTLSLPPLPSCHMHTGAGQVHAGDCWHVALHSHLTKYCDASWRGQRWSPVKQPPEGTIQCACTCSYWVRPGSPRQHITTS